LTQIALFLALSYLTCLVAHRYVCVQIEQPAGSTVIAGITEKTGRIKAVQNKDLEGILPVALAFFLPNHYTKN
jgi:hypothetical protein